jgi:hypothetical protein
MLTKRGLATFLAILTKTHLVTLALWSQEVENLFAMALENVLSRVARWFIFKPKIPNWAHFGGLLTRKYLYILLPFGIFYEQLGYFMNNWDIL